MKITRRKFLPLLSIVFLPLGFLSGLWEAMMFKMKPRVSSSLSTGMESGKEVVGRGFSPSETEELRMILGEAIYNINPLADDVVIPWWFYANWVVSPEEREQVERWLACRRGNRIPRFLAGWSAYHARKRLEVVNDDGVQG